MIGQHKRDFALAPYRPEWADLFEEEAERLRGALGETALRIEHIGSTSIPDMSAKAIIDIMTAVPILRRSSELILALDSLGYTYKPFDIIAERMFFSKEIEPEIRTHHLSLVEEGSDYWKNQLLFRDTLRADEQLAQAYIAVNQGFAAYYARTNHVDPEWKSAFVAKVLALAKQEGRE